MSDFSAPPILTCAETARFERRFFQGDETAEWAAMQRAGRAIGASVRRDFEALGGFPARGRVLVLAGKGHNGGDALIAAREILERFPASEAVVGFLFGERSLRPLAQRAWRELVQGAGERVVALPIGAWAADGARYDVCLDGVFGFQFRPPLPAAIAAAFRRVNSLPVRLRAAVDLPSGLDDPQAFRADFTYATGILKAPLLDCAAAGRVRFIDLGFFAAGKEIPGPDRVLTPSLLVPLGVLRPSRSDKRSYGHLLIVGGSRQYPGAVLMNALAALHSGAGLVTVFVPRSLAPGFAARAPEAMWVGCPETVSGGLALDALPLFQERLKRASAVAMGSGLGRDPETLELARTIAANTALPLLLDGDALQPELIAAAKGPLVLTPHAGEFKRIARNAHLRAFCARTGATVALKGPVTQICTGAGPAGTPSKKAAARIYHSFFGGPVLARGGSGDILAGLTGGLLAQAGAAKAASAPAGDSSLLAAVCRGVVWHGLAADALARSRGETSVSVTALVDCFPEALREAAATIEG